MRVLLQSIKNWIRWKWQGRFKFGPVINLGEIMVNVYQNRTLHIGLGLFRIGSPGSGHWPFTAFEFKLKTGERAAWHLGLLGFIVGTVWLPNLDEAGKLAGPDYRKLYFAFSCINHQHKQLEEII